MNATNKFLALLLTIAVIACIGFALSPTHAQETPSIGDERLSTISTSTSATTALVSAVTGKKIIVKALLLNADTAGVYILTDGSGGTTIANIYLAQNTECQITDKILSDVLRTTSGTGLYIDGPSSSACRAICRYRAE